MKFLKQIFLSTPVVLILGLSFIIIGFYLVFAIFFAISYYIEISFSIGIIVLIALLVIQYFKFRKPRLLLHDWESDSEKEKKLQNYKNWNEEFRLIVLSGFFVSVITVANYWIGIVTAPIIFLIYGSYCLVVTYLINKGRFDSRSRNTTQTESLGATKPTGIPRTLINYFVILAIVSGFWAFQIQKNTSQLKQDGYSFLNDLSGLRYCQEFQSSCVAIDKIQSVEFKQIDSSDGPGKTWQMCFGINYEYSRFGGFYESDYRIEDYCFSNEYYGNSWGESEIESKIYTRLKQLAY